MHTSSQTVHRMSTRPNSAGVPLARRSFAGNSVKSSVFWTVSVQGLPPVTSITQFGDLRHVTHALDRLYVYMYEHAVDPIERQRCDSERPGREISGPCRPQPAANPEYFVAPVHVRMRLADCSRLFTGTHFAPLGLFAPCGPGSGPAWRNLGLLFAGVRGSLWRSTGAFDPAASAAYAPVSSGPGKAAPQ